MSLDNREQRAVSHQSLAAGAEADAQVLYELISVLWRHKFALMLIIFIGMASGAAWLYQQPDYYQSSALLAPADPQEASFGSNLQSLGGLAGLAGVGLSGNGLQTKTRLAIEVLQSRAFIVSFIERYDLLPELVAVKHWDPVKSELVYNSELYDPAAREWTPDAKEAEGFLSLQRAFERFSDAMTVSELSGGWVSLQIEHASPIVAQQWVDLLTQDLNISLKQKEVAEAERSISYLRDQIEKTPLTELKVMFYELIQAKTETVMLAMARPEYIFQTIDPAIAPEQPAGPNRSLMLAIFAVLSTIVAVLAVLAKHYVLPLNRR